MSIDPAARLNVANAGRRPPVRVMFLHTTADIGGAETITLNLIRRLDRSRFQPELCCLKVAGDDRRNAVGGNPRLRSAAAKQIRSARAAATGAAVAASADRRDHFRRRRRQDVLGAVGRSAGRRAGDLSAIHSTGFPDRIGRLNRTLTPLTDMFIGVADAHGRYLVEQERFPAEKVCVIPNGIDTDRFRPRAANPELRRRLGLRPGPVAGTVARLGPEKNHELFLEAAACARREVPDAQFLLIGDGPLDDFLRQRARQLGIADCVHFLGWRSDVAELLGLLDVFLLTSHIEANPVSILEALATGVPVVSTRVGSVAETVGADAGFLVEPGDAAAIAGHLVRLFHNPILARTMGMAGRESVLRRWSLDQMVLRYEDLIEDTFRRKRPLEASRRPAPCPPLVETSETGFSQQLMHDLQGVSR